MRALLWAGLALALVLAAALWRLSRVPVSLDVPLVQESPAAIGSPRVLSEAEPAAVDAPSAAAETTTAARELERPITTGRVQGTLVEADCGRPIGCGVRIWLSSPGVSETIEPGADGRFATAGDFPSGPVRVKLLEARSGEELHAFTIEFDPSKPETWRMALGLLVPLEIVAPGGVAPSDVSALWIDEGAERQVNREWGQKLQGGEQPFVRAFFGVSDRAQPLELYAVLPDGRGFVGRAALTTTHGVHDLLRVELVERTRAFGRVLDGAGAGLFNARVRMLSLASGQHRIATSELEGRFSFEDVEPGPAVLTVSSGLSSAEPRRFELRPGANDLGAIMLARGEGQISGELYDPQSDAEPLALVSLRDLATDQRWFTWTDEFSRSGKFAFDGVSPGRYEVRPLPTAGLRFEPASRDVTSPATALEFVVSRSDAGGLYLRALDGRGGPPLDRFAYAGRVEDLWVGGTSSPDEALPFAAERWVVSAEGHGAAIVEPIDAKGTRVVDVPLQRGWGQVLVFVDAEQNRSTESRLARAFGRDAFEPRLGAPLAGVHVLADGRKVATSGRDGLAVVSLAREPERLEFELSGRRALGSRVEDGLRYVWMARSE